MLGDVGICIQGYDLNVALYTIYDCFIAYKENIILWWHDVYT